MQVIEFLGAGQQYVIEGTHPKGGRYTWEDDRDLATVGASALTETTAEKLEQAVQLLKEKWLPALGATDISVSGTSGGETSRHKIGDETLLAPGFEDQEATLTFDVLDPPAWFHVVADALCTIPNKDRPRESWVEIAHAVKAATNSSEQFYGLVFEPWCLDHPDNTTADARKLWDSIKTSKVGWDRLRAIARDHGWKDPCEGFATVGSNADVPTIDIFDRYVYVENIKRFFDLESRQTLDKEQFKDRHSEYGNPWRASRNAYARYMTNLDRRRLVARPTYRPGEGPLMEEDGDPVVNTWRPGTIIPAEGDVTPWLELVEFLVPDQREREIILDRMAFDLQHPGRKCNWAILFGGTQGIGKDTMFQPLVAGTGQHNVSYVRPSDLTDGWTDYLRCKVVIVEEMANFSKTDITNALKSLIASPPAVVRVNIKYVPQFFIPNIQSWYFFTNKHDAMSLEDSDRRCFIYWSPVTEAEAKKRTLDGYYTRLHQWLEDGGNANVVHWLLRRDISNFNPNGQAPDTEAKREMIALNRRPVEVWVRTSISDEVGVFAQDLVTIEKITDYAQHTTSVPRAVQQGITENSLALALKAAGAIRVGRTRLGKGQGYVRIWAVRRTQTYSALNEAELRSRYLSQIGGRPSDHEGDTAFQPLSA